MSKHVLLGTLGLILLPASATAQGVCPLNGTSSNKLVCVIPQTFGPFGLGSGTGAPLIANGHQAHFEGDFLSSFGPINEAVGIQVSQLPIASPPRVSPSHTIRRLKPSRRRRRKAWGQFSASAQARSDATSFTWRSVFNTSISTRSMDRTPAVFPLSYSISRSRPARPARTKLE